MLQPTPALGLETMMTLKPRMSGCVRWNVKFGRRGVRLGKQCAVTLSGNGPRRRNTRGRLKTKRARPRKPGRVGLLEMQTSGRRSHGRTRRGRRGRRTARRVQEVMAVVEEEARLTIGAGPQTEARMQRAGTDRMEHPELAHSIGTGLGAAKTAAGRVEAIGPATSTMSRLEDIGAPTPRKAAANAEDTKLVVIAGSTTRQEVRPRRMELVGRSTIASNSGSSTLRVLGKVVVSPVAAQVRRRISILCLACRAVPTQRQSRTRTARRRCSIIRTGTVMTRMHWNR
mmetsp:Transcript_5506/g.11612  ORF Transcript_5506/g.11612 Transcript_5506/m.11612 type:complete len:285 (-) Transcript_5506:881-1735(-)